MQTLQYQQPQQFQPIPQQYAPPKSYDEIIRDTSSYAKKDSLTYQLISQLSQQRGYPLSTDSLFWNKYSKLRIKQWGGAVTDQTILVNNQRMPIIRTPNHSQNTWNVSIDTIPITVGNQRSNTPLQIISLRQYLSDIYQFITIKDTPNDSDDDNKDFESLSNGYKVSLLSNSDNTVIMDTQYSVLPLNPLGVTQFTLATLNWKTGLKNPSVLYIVSTKQGTSSVVIEGNFQKVYYNKNGYKSPFVIENNDMNNSNECLTIIQVPLRQKTRKQIEEEQAENASWGITNWWSSNTEKRKRVFDVLPTNCKDAKVQQLLKDYGYHETEEEKVPSDKPKISRSGIKVIPSTVPTYCCSRPLTKCEAQTCYGEKNANITVSCDGCGGSYSGADVIWHCPDTITTLHPNGYDLCDKCAQKQMIHDELRGLKGLRRDERYKIRVTLMYYKPIINGVMNESIINEMIQKLVSSDNLGSVQTQTSPRTQMSLSTPNAQMSVSPQRTQPTQMYNRPIQRMPVPIQSVRVPKPVVKPGDYRVILSALTELKLNTEFLKIFQTQNVTDSVLRLLNDSDLNILFPNALGPKVRFRKWLKDNEGKLKRGNRGNIDQSQYRAINNIFRSINVANAQKYISNFMSNGINDKMVGFLNDRDLEILISDMSVRVMFRRYVRNMQPQTQSGSMQQPMQQAQPTQKFLF